MVPELIATISLVSVVITTLILSNQTSRLNTKFKSSLSELVDKINYNQKLELKFDNKQLHDLRAMGENIGDVRKTYQRLDDLAKNVTTNSVNANSVRGNNFIADENIRFNSVNPESSSSLEYNIGRGNTKNNFNRLQINTPNLIGSGFDITTTGFGPRFSIDSKSGDVYIPGKLVNDGGVTTTGSINQLRDSWFPYTDGNSYLRASGDGKVINIGDYYNNDVNIGKPNTNVNLRGSVNSPAGIHVNNGDPGPLIDKNYGSADNRYGVGQFPNGQTRVYTAGAYQPANVSLSIAKNDGSFVDAVTVNKDGNLNPTTTVNGNLIQNGTIGLYDNKIRFRGINDGTHSLGYDSNVDGPTLQGNSGGKLATVNGQTALQWDNIGNTLTNGTKMSKNWTAYPDSRTDGSEIANDTGNFQQLMIVGNRSGGGERRVGVWDTLNVNGTLNANGPINTPAGIHVNNGDPGPLIDKNYGTNDNRYGIGQFGNGQTRVYTAGGAWQPGNVNLSIAKPDGSFVDALTVSKDNSLNPTTTVNGAFNVNGTASTGDLYANNTKMSKNWSGYPDGRADGSEIANDTNGFKQLMIVGNKSGGGERRVGVWDTLNVNGKLNVNGDQRNNGNQMFQNAAIVSSDGRLHIAPSELLYLLPKNGVINSKAWGGTGTFQSEGKITTNDQLCINGTCLTESQLANVKKVTNS